MQTLSAEIDEVFYRTLGNNLDRLWSLWTSLERATVKGTEPCACAFLSYRITFAPTHHFPSNFHTQSRAASRPSWRRPHFRSLSTRRSNKRLQQATRQDKTQTGTQVVCPENACAASIQMPSPLPRSLSLVVEQPFVRPLTTSTTSQWSSSSSVFTCFFSLVSPLASV